MALDVCNASVSFDIKGAQDKLYGLALNDFPGENLTDFVAKAQKYDKIMQGGYALPIRVGSKLLMKCTKTECEFFNRKAFDFLDRVKGMEDGYKLSDPASMTHHTAYTTLGPIGIITWVQREHAMFVRDSEWPALTTTLPQGNNATVVDHNYRTIMTCYHCGEDGHIKPKCPRLKEKITSKVSVPKEKDEKSDGEPSEPKVRNPLAAWNKIRPFDLTKPHEENAGQKWMFCTKCKDFLTGKKGVFNLSHFDADHQENYKTTPPAASTPATTATHAAPEGKLMMAHESIDHVPTGPPLATVLEPANEIDLKEITFTGDWCCPIANAPSGVTSVTHILKPEQTDDMSVLAGMSSGSPGPLINRGDNSSSDNSDVDQDNAMYYPWENDIDANIDEKNERKAQSENVICSLTGFINLVFLSVLALATIIVQWGSGLFQNAAARYVIDPSWRAIFLPLLCINTVLWDAVRYIAVSPPKIKEQPRVPRRILCKSARRARTRGSWIPPLYFFAASWLVFEGTVRVYPSSYQGQCPAHPFKEVNSRLSATYIRIIDLDLKVVLLPGMSVQYQSIQATQAWYEMYPKKSVEREMKEVVHEEEFFYSFQNLPCVLDGVFSEFLDARDDLAIYVDNSILDLLQLDSIYRDRFVVDAVGTLSTELYAECEANLLPSKKAMELLTDYSWLMPVAAFSTFATQNVPVIFDTGASLLITPYSADFIMPPAAPQNATKLGGMAGNLDIMGVGTVSWKFLASDGL
jgi:hypothetical protein